MRIACKIHPNRVDVKQECNQIYELPIRKSTGRPACVKSRFFNIRKLNYTVIRQTRTSRFATPKCARRAAAERVVAPRCKPAVQSCKTYPHHPSGPLFTIRKGCEHEMQGCAKQTCTSRFVQPNGERCVAAERFLALRFKPAPLACKRFHHHPPRPLLSTITMVDKMKKDGLK